MSRYTAVPLVSAYSHFSPSRWWALPCTTVNKTSVEDCSVGHLHQHPPPPPQVYFRCCHMLAGSNFFVSFFFFCFTWGYYLTELMAPCKVSEWLMSLIMSEFHLLNKRTWIINLKKKYYKNTLLYHQTDCVEVNASTERPCSSTVWLF